MGSIEIEARRLLTTEGQRTWRSQRASFWLLDERPVRSSSDVRSSPPRGSGARCITRLASIVTSIPLLLSVSLWLTGLTDSIAVAEVPQLTPEQLESSATDIVLGVVESRAIDESDDGGYRERRFTFQVRVEETLKGELERGAVIPVTAWTRLWVGPGEQPPGSNGHAPLPLDGELARFFLGAEDDAFAVVLPNGVELGGGADASDPVRWGDPPRIIETDTTETTPPTKDPFGWDVMLLLLAAPILIGSFRQRGKARWILLGISTLLMSGAALIVLL